MESQSHSLMPSSPMEKRGGVSPTSTAAMTKSSTSEHETDSSRNTSTSTRTSPTSVPALLPADSHQYRGLAATATTVHAETVTSLDSKSTKVSRSIASVDYANQHPEGQGQGQGQGQRELRNDNSSKKSPEPKLKSLKRGCAYCQESDYGLMVSFCYHYGKLLRFIPPPSPSPPPSFPSLPSLPPPYNSFSCFRCFVFSAKQVFMRLVYVSIIVLTQVKKVEKRVLRDQWWILQPLFAKNASRCNFGLLEG